MDCVLRLAWTSGPGEGRLSFISATPGGKSSVYQGCFWISGMVMRFSGLSTRILLNRSRQDDETLSCEGKSYSTFKILCK